jgi:hypothetical protein
MPGFTREYCLAKIAELEEKAELYRDSEALADYLQMLAGWRWLAERAVEKSSESAPSGTPLADGSCAAEPST